MSRRFAVLGQLLSALGEGEDAVSDNDLEKIAESDELTAQLRAFIKQIVDDDRRVKQEERAGRTSMEAVKVDNLAGLAGPDVVLDNAIIKVLKQNGVVYVRDLLRVSYDSLHAWGLTKAQSLQLEEVLRELALHLAPPASE